MIRCKQIWIGCLCIFTTVISMSMAKPTPQQLGIWYGRWVALQHKFSDILMSSQSSELRKKQLVVLMQSINASDYGCLRQELVKTFCSLSYLDADTESSSILQHVEQALIGPE